MSITIFHPTGILKGYVNLPLSKSESNRILILQALSKGKVDAERLSDARDTKLLQAALATDTTEINVEDAGTAMRFLSAYYCATNQHKILTGSERMQERPIGILVDALRDIGFNIKYPKNEGFPPLEIIPIELSALKSEVYIAGNISSQYISALAMIAPVLPCGLIIHFTTEIASAPYIDMTIEMMAGIGIYYSWDEKRSRLSIQRQEFREDRLSAYADWSAASYWFSMAALANEADIFLNKLNPDTRQGDVKIFEWAGKFGVRMEIGQGGWFLKNGGVVFTPLHFDFIHNPDLAQTIIVLCAAKSISATFTGLQSLRIKETDRIVALQNELLKFGVRLYEVSEGVFSLDGTFTMSHQTIKTYNDHRMAMAFAPLAILGKITIEHPEVVGKSYPDFWKEMEKIGFILI